MRLSKIIDPGIQILIAFFAFYLGQLCFAAKVEESQEQRPTNRIQIYHLQRWM